MQNCERNVLTCRLIVVKHTAMFLVWRDILQGTQVDLTNADVSNAVLQGHQVILPNPGQYFWHRVQFEEVGRIVTRRCISDIWSSILLACDIGCRLVVITCSLIPSLAVSLSLSLSLSHVISFVIFSPPPTQLQLWLHFVMPHYGQTTTAVSLVFMSHESLLR